MRYLFLVLSLFLSLGFVSLASDGDTITVKRFNRYGPNQIALPIRVDSIDLHGKPYDPKTLLSLSPYLDADQAQESRQVERADGWLETPNELKSEGQAQSTTYEVFLLNREYEKGTLLIRCTTPYIAYLDGKEVKRREAYRAEVDEPDRISQGFNPTTHKLQIHTLVQHGDTVPAKLQVQWAAEREKSTMELRTDPTRYFDLEQTVSGPSLRSVSLSPSGEYMTVLKRVVTDYKPSTSVLLYRGSKLVAQLGAEFGSLQWMPRSDKAFYTREVPTGRELVTYDPATMTEQVLHHNIPDGDFVMGPSETILIYLNKIEGPKRAESFERILSREDRLPGSRNRRQISVLDLKTGIYRPLTFGYRGISLSDIAPDDSKLIYATSQETTVRPFSTQTYVELDLGTMKVDTLIKQTSDVSRMWYTNRKGMFVVLGSASAFGGVGVNLPPNRIVNTYDMQLFLYDRSTGKATPLTKNFDPSVGQVLVPHGEYAVYFTAEDKDLVPLYRCDLSTGKITRIAKAEEFVSRFSASNDGRTIAYFGQSALNSDRLYTIQGGRERLVYDLSKEKMEGITIAQMREWDFTTPSGEKVQGRYYLPPNFDPSRKYPLIVYYYAGTSPTSRKLEMGNYALPMYASQDYIVYTLNPSGTTGFGQEYASRHVNAWGKQTADDIVSAVKGFCAAHPYVNADKIGCLGASYGGFMTQYLQTVTDIFAAAVSHAGISALSSYWGEGFWGVGYSTVASADSYPWNNPKLYVEQSPLFHADRINTPLLLLHGQDDTNVPEGESVQMYNALKILGKEVEFIRVYGENHVISDPKKVVGWTHSIMAWFARWLKDDPTWWNDLYPEVHL